MRRVPCARRHCKVSSTDTCLNALRFSFQYADYFSNAGKKLWSYTQATRIPLNMFMIGWGSKASVANPEMSGSKIPQSLALSTPNVDTGKSCIDYHFRRIFMKILIKSLTAHISIPDVALVMLCFHVTALLFLSSHNYIDYLIEIWAIYTPPFILPTLRFNNAAQMSNRQQTVQTSSSKSFKKGNAVCPPDLIH